MPQYSVISNGSPISYANASGTQAFFPSTPSVTVAGTTSYLFDAGFVFYKTTAGNGVTFSLLFGGTATRSSILYTGTFSSSTDTTGIIYDSAPTFFSNSTATAFNISGIINLAAVFSWGIRFQGVVRINAGGTFTPQFSLSGVPNATYIASTGSYFRLAPIGDASSAVSWGWV